jgi:hypothetical protein
MTHQEDAAVDREQAPGGDPIGYRPPTEPNCGKLRSADDAMLLCRKRSDRAIRGIGEFGIHAMHKPAMAGDAPGGCGSAA